jgi:hypothetical protein
MSFHDSEGLMSSTSDRTASRNFASSAVSFFLSGADRCLAIAVDCLSLWMLEVVKAGLLVRWDVSLLLLLDCDCGDVLVICVAEVLGSGDSRSRSLKKQSTPI